MSDYNSVVKKNPKMYLTPLYDDIQARRDKDFFWPTGTQIYCGKQGSGKTISAVYHILALKKRYPKMILISNLKFTTLTPHVFSTKSELRRLLNTAREGVEGSVNPDSSSPPLSSTELNSRSEFSEQTNYDSEPNLAVTFNTATDYIQFSSMAELSFLLVEVNNGRQGVVLLIDEIHTYFNALDSKNIPMYVFTEISQQRKQRKCIIGTSQLFKRMALPFREQCDSMIMCKTYFGILTIQKVYDGDYKTDNDDNIISKARKTGFFFHNRGLRNAYDTFQKVISGSDQYMQTIKVNVSESKNKKR